MMFDQCALDNAKPYGLIVHAQDPSHLTTSQYGRVCRNGPVRMPPTPPLGSRSGARPWGSGGRSAGRTRQALTKSSRDTSLRAKTAPPRLLSECSLSSTPTSYLPSNDPVDRAAAIFGAACCASPKQTAIGFAIERLQ